MPIKALRMQIIKPYNIPDDKAEPLTWEMLGKQLRDLRYAASKMANYVIQKNYMWEYFKQEYKFQHGVLPAAKDHTDKLYSYPDLTRMFPEVAGQMVNQIEQHAKKVWKTRRSEVLKLHQSVPSFKLNFPIIVHNESYSLMQTPDQQENFRNFSMIIKANLGSMKSGRTSYSFVVDAGEKSKRAIVERIISGIYKKGALQITSDRKGKWYCIIPYTFEVEHDTELDPTRIMGIDLGITKAAYWAFSDSLKRGFINGNEIEEFRKRVQARRKSIQDQGKYCGDGRIGHGRARRIQPIEVLQEKEANFRATTNHKYARHIVENAVRAKCGVIQMEDLTGITADNAFLKNWTYYDLQSKIKEKAAVEGILVRLIKPAFTSQRCSRCGHINKENRVDQATFSCVACGYGNHYHCYSCDKDQDSTGPCNSCGSSSVKQVYVNADYNAAKNIATEGIEELIAAELANTEGGETEVKSAKAKRTRKSR